MVLDNSDDIDNISLNRRSVAATFSALEKESRLLSLPVEDDKTKYILSTTKEAARMVVYRSMVSVSVDNYTCEVGTTSVNTTNNISLKIQRRLTLAK